MTRVLVNRRTAKKTRWIRQMRGKNTSNGAICYSCCELVWSPNVFDSLLAGRHRNAEGIIFYRCDFFFFLSFFFFSTPDLWGHWTDLNQTWTHIHLWLLFEKFGPNSHGHLSPYGLGAKTLFGTDFEHWPKRLNTVGEFLTTIPPKFPQWETLPASPHGRYITNSRQTLTRVM